MQSSLLLSEKSGLRKPEVQLSVTDGQVGAGSDHCVPDHFRVIQTSGGRGHRSLVLIDAKAQAQHLGVAFASHQSRGVAGPASAGRGPYTENRNSGSRFGRYWTDTEFEDPSLAG